MYRLSVSLYKHRNSSRAATSCSTRLLVTKRQQRSTGANHDSDAKSPESPTSTSSTALKNPPSLITTTSSLIHTDLRPHVDWMESIRPSFDPQNPPPFQPNPLGVVNRDLTEAVMDIRDLYDPRFHFSMEKYKGYEDATPLSQDLMNYIAVRGTPITVAEYMRQALTHPLYGYYTNPSNDDDDDDWDKDDDSWDENVDTLTPDQLIIGRRGDFITAPEISQVFGECLLVWFITQWKAMGEPSKIQIVEVGPGKGTLMSDICRYALSTFEDFGKAIQTIHLVEASPAMRAEQQRRLSQLNNVNFEFETYQVDSIFQSEQDKGTTPSKGPQNESQPSPSQTTVNSDDTTNNKHTIRVQWHDSFASVMRHSLASDTNTKPPLPTLVLCQEFIDALPVHVFEKTNDGWRERMVDIAARPPLDEEGKDEEKHDETLVDKDNVTTLPDETRKPRLCYVLSPEPTPALKTLLKVDSSGVMENEIGKVGDVCEVCPEGILLIQDIAQLVAQNRGAALIVDYGQEGSTDSVRAFSKHEQVHVLSRPGKVDVTADVDFGALRHAVNSRHAEPNLPHAFGPVTQGKFLASMGAMERVSQLIEDDDTTEQQAVDLFSALERLVLPEHMGERYKVLAIARKKDGIFAPPGF